MYYIDFFLLAVGEVDLNRHYNGKKCNQFLSYLQHGTIVHSTGHISVSKYDRTIILSSL